MRAACQFIGFLPAQGFSVCLDDSQRFQYIEDPSIKGQIDSEFTYITAALFDEEELELQVNCYIDATHSSKSRLAAPTSTLCHLSIIVFGPSHLFDDVGSFFEDHNLYLRDPVNCARNALYRNPHRLSMTAGSTVWTSDLEKEHANAVVLETTQTRPELIDILNSQEDLVETEQPGSIMSVMKR